MWKRVKKQKKMQRTCLDGRPDFRQPQQCLAFCCRPQGGGSRPHPGKSPLGGTVTMQHTTDMGEIAEHLGIFLYVFARKLFATHGLVENFWSDGRNQNGVHSSQFHINLRQNDDLLWVLPIWSILPWDIDWRGSGVKSCSHSSPEDEIEFWNYPGGVQTHVLKKRDLNTLRSHPQNSVTHSFDLHTRI